MTSSCDRILRGAAVSERLYRVGEAARGIPNPIDTRPYTVIEAEERHAREIARLKDQQQAALEDAYRNGYQDGSAMARDDATDRLNRLQEWIDTLTGELATLRPRAFAASERQAVDLICRALVHILGDRPAREDRIRHALRRAFAQLTSQDAITVHCHPADLEMVKEILAGKEAEVTAGKRVRVVADDLVGVNGCLVETDLGVIDARIETQLAVLRGVLMETAPEIEDDDMMTTIAGVTDAVENAVPAVDDTPEAPA